MRHNVSYHSNGKIAYRAFENRTEDDPPGRAWNKAGQFIIEEYTIDGKRHRVDGPAYRLWGDDGTLKTELYYKHGELHRKMGPATMNIYGDLIVCEYWVDGKHLYTTDEQHVDDQDQLYLHV